MRRNDLYDWILAHGCKQAPLDGINVRGNSIKFINPKVQGTHAYLNTPIDHTEVYDFIVCQICVQLVIPIPDHAKDQLPLVNHIKHKHKK